MPKTVLARVIAATALLAGLAAVAAAASEADIPTYLERLEMLLFAGACAVAALAVATGRWWARFVALGIALFGALSPFALGMGRGILPLSGVALFACLGGRAMIEQFEGHAPLPMMWMEPRMGVLRWALITSTTAFMGDVTSAIGSNRSIAIARRLNLLGPGSLDFMVATLVLTVVLTVGLLLLARQRTLGLLVCALAALPKTVLFLVTVWQAIAAELWPSGMILCGTTPFEWRIVVMMSPLSVVAIWAAIVVWARPMLRFLRG